LYYAAPREVIRAGNRDSQGLDRISYKEMGCHMDREFPLKFSSVLGASRCLLVTRVCGAEDRNASTPAPFSNYELAGNPLVTPGAGPGL